MLKVKSVICRGCPFICKFSRSYQYHTILVHRNTKIGLTWIRWKIYGNLWCEYPINQHCNNVGIVNNVATWNKIPEGLPEVSIYFNTACGYVIIVTGILTLPLHAIVFFTVTMCQCKLKPFFCMNMCSCHTCHCSDDCAGALSWPILCGFKTQLCLVLLLPSHICTWR